MNEIQDPAQVAEMASRLRRLEQLAFASSGRDPSALRPGQPDGRLEGAGGAAIRRAGRDHPGISPWLFVMATALNTMVAAVLAVIITLGVVRQEQRTDTEPRDGVLAAAYARAEPAQQ